MGQKLMTPAGQTRYARRKWLSEAPNGWFKEVLGFRRFSFRGLEKVQAEWDLVCLAAEHPTDGRLGSLLSYATSDEMIDEGVGRVQRFFAGR